MDFRQAVKALGGAAEVQRLTGISRQLITYWAKRGEPPYWRSLDRDKIITAALSKKRRNPSIGASDGYSSERK